MKIILLHLFTCLVFTNAFSQTDPHHIQPYHPGEVILWFENASVKKTFTQNPKWMDGREVLFSEERTLSSSLNISLFNFSGNVVDSRVLTFLRSFPGIRFAQFNHILSERNTIPNDPDFTQQWDKHNTGQNGGTPDADMDAPEAWDITTGGLTATGDSIIIAIIDGGFDLTHEDISFFKNYDEIPNNSIDDDNNGYVDDFDGWDAMDHDGNPNDPAGDHGTHVCGIAAAKGNNNIGIAGVNWGAKVLPIIGSSGDEATVVEAYGYAFEMRKLYNTTNGTKGAFIVSTNSSFGVDFGQPVDYPIWCAMYDSLGSVGILSAGATANQNTDVDVDGDIPTACSSDWLISVTNTTNTDQKNNGAAYGLTTIDLGSPGTAIYSCLPSDTYGNLTGTSMATPQVAGAIALVYAAACSTFINDYKASPAAYALQVKNFLMQGVDTLPNLVALTLSGGRLNLFNSCLKMVDFCSGGCYAPFGLNVANLTDTTAQLQWANVTSSDTFHIRWRMVGDTTWNYGADTVNTFPISGLTGCNDYEFQVESVCDTTPSGWSNLFSFSSEGCCVPPSEFSLISTDDTSATLSWGDVYAAINYTIQYRPTGTGIWTTISSTSDTLILTGLLNCTEYEWQVETECDTSTSGFSPSQIFRTKGCGACEEGLYCASQFDPSFEWIEEITIGALHNLSGDDGGYGNYVGVPTSMNSGATYPVTLVPGYSFIPFPDYWKIFLDTNADGDFDDAGEEIFSSGGTATNTVTGNATLPAVVIPGITRLRIIQRFNTAPAPCDDQEFGEVEDYCVDLILGNESRFSDRNILIYPNPATSILNIRNDSDEMYDVEISDQLGKVLLLKENQSLKNCGVDISELPQGLYFVKVKTENSGMVKSFVKM